MGVARRYAFGRVSGNAAISLSFTAGRRQAMRRLLDVVAIDLIEGRVSGERLVAAEVAPFGSRRGRLRGDDRVPPRRTGSGRPEVAWRVPWVGLSCNRKYTEILPL